MGSTVVGLFDNAAEVKSVQQELMALGIPASSIRTSSQPGATTANSATATTKDKGFWEELKEMFTGSDEHQYAGYYAEGTRRGGTLVTVDAPDELADRAAEVLRKNHAVDIDTRASQWSKEGWTGYEGAHGSAATAGNTRKEMAVPVVEEKLEVGKRQVAGGGVRVVRRVTEKPVSENIELREERVSVQRRPVQRDLNGADLDEAFQDKTIEVSESSEVAVAAKSARVVEEVIVNKEVNQRTEQVRDTVRRSDVQVERIPGKETAETSTKTSESGSAAAPTRTKTPQP